MNEKQKIENLNKDPWCLCIILESKLAKEEFDEKSEKVKYHQQYNNIFHLNLIFSLPQGRS
jgi:hypothetical protein